jgi:hypothetical protein
MTGATLVSCGSELRLLGMPRQHVRVPAADPSPSSRVPSADSTAFTRCSLSVRPAATAWSRTPTPIH